MKNRNVAIIVILLLTTTGAAFARGNSYREAALAADTARAAADTARRVAEDLLNDSSIALQRLIVQVELEKDSLDRVLEQRPVVRVPMGIRIDTLRIRDTTEVVVQDTMKTYSWEGQDGPFGISGDASIFPDGRGIFGVRVMQVSDINVDAVIGCIDRDGINSASVTLTSQRPFNVVPGRVEQLPGVCNNPIPSFKAFNLDVNTAKWTIPLGIGAGVLIGKAIFGGGDKVHIHHVNNDY